MTQLYPPRPARFPQPGETDVLFVTYGGGHCRMVIPVAQALEARGVKTCVFAMTLAIAPVRGSGLNWFGYADLPQAHDPEVRAKGVELSRGFPADGPVSLEETIAYMGLNYRDLERNHGDRAAELIFRASGRFIFHPRPLMREMLEHLRPRVVVATNSPRSEQAAIEAASALGIPALAMIDVFGIQAKEWMKNPEFGRKICVLNEPVKQMLVNSGRPAEDVHVTGNPAFDQLLAEDVRARGGAMRAARGWGAGGRRTILYASAPEPPTDPYSHEPADLGLPLKVEEQLKQIVAADAGLELVIRRHPSEDQGVFLAERVYQSTMADNIDVLLHAVDIVAVTCSTVGFQAYLAGRDVLSVECSVVSPDAPYGAFGISRAAMSLPQIEPVLRDILARPRHHHAGMQISAGQAIADQVEQLLRDGRHAG